jgi:hypothetical protein
MAALTVFERRASTEFRFDLNTLLENVSIFRREFPLKGWRTA